MSESRLFKIVYILLHRQHVTAPELAAEFEVSTRTIYRDIDALSSAGIPIYAEQGRNGGIHLMDHYIMERSIMSEQEQQELLMAVQSMSVTGISAQKDMLTKLSGIFQMEPTTWM